MRRPITAERFHELREKTPKRICFGRKKSALSKGGDGPAVGFFSVPFNETLEALFPWTLESATGRYGPFFRRIIRKESEFANIEEWLEENEEHVFLRSLLESCVALSEHQIEPGRRTEVGELENAAKFDQSSGAASEIADRMEEMYRRLHSDSGISAICAVPPSTAGTFSLPGRLASDLSERLGLKNISDRLAWSGPKPSIKNADADRKWNILEGVGLTIKGNVKGERVLIIDDMYQSGCTVHFVASKLEEAGAAEVHCLAVVKARRDTDNA